jgi:cell division ATPase FtsA
MMRKTAAVVFSGLLAAGAITLSASPALAGVTCVNNGDGTRTVTLTSGDGTVLSETTYEGECRSQRK